MKINPISINGNSCKEFNSSSIEDLDVIVGGYIFTPKGEIILVDENEEHCNVFSDYINSYLENNQNTIYDILTATQMLCELGCCVYAGVRYKEYISSNFGNGDLCSLTFPNDMEKLTQTQKDICLSLISKNKSLFGNREKVYIQYGSFPENVYSEEQIVSILKANVDKKGM